MVFYHIVTHSAHQLGGDRASVRDEPKKNLNPYSASSSFGRADKKEETREKEA